MPLKPSLGLSLAVFLASLVQSAVLPFLVPPSFRPDLVFITAAIGAWLTGPVAGAALGLWGGLLTACLGGGYIGSLAFSRMVACHAVGRVREEVYGDSPALLAALAPVSYLLAEGVFFLLNPHHPLDGPAVLRRAALAALLAPLGWMLMRRLVREREP